MVSEHPGKTLREALGLSQVDFAARIGITQPHVSSVESGQRGYGIPTILAIMDRYRPQCVQLGITAEDLARGIEDGAEA